MRRPLNKTETARTRPGQCVLVYDLRKGDEMTVTQLVNITDDQALCRDAKISKRFTFIRRSLGIGYGAVFSSALAGLG